MSLWLLIACRSPAPEAYEVPHRSAPIALDGRLDDPDWSRATPLPFRSAWEKLAPRDPATARLLWDGDALYLGADLVDRDLVASRTVDDSKTWHDDVVEVFLSPGGERGGYYEIHVTPRGTVTDLYIPGPDHDFDALVGAHPFHVERAVQAHGTLEDRSDRDTGWTVEVRVPFSDLAPTGGAPSPGDRWAFTVCRYDHGPGDPDLSCTAPLSAPDFHRRQDWSVLRFAAAR